MKVLVTGAGGQLGHSLVRSAPAGIELVATGSADFDLREVEAIAERVADIAPDLLINAAAYTAVDRAESDRDTAAAINRDAVGALAAAAARRGAGFVHVSTDFVFGNGASRPIPVDAATDPLGVYGRTKRDGEDAARAAHPDALIVRTAWVYSARGANFVKTMLRLMRERDELRVVADQIGAPTYAPGLANALWTMARTGLSGTFHYSDRGVASWYDFAVAIAEEAEAIGLLDKRVAVLPIRTEDYPTPAVRPTYSLLDTSQTYAALGHPGTHWRVNLRKMLTELEEHG
jgi:dTDP-4-dehydrorhamnose reductase